MKIEIDTDNLTEEQKRVLRLCDELTPAEKKGWKEGYYGIVEKDTMFVGGSIVRLNKDDRSRCPKFELVAGEPITFFVEFGNTCSYVDLNDVKLIGKGEGKYE